MHSFLRLPSATRSYAWQHMPGESLKGHDVSCCAFCATTHKLACLMFSLDLSLFMQDLEAAHGRLETQVRSLHAAVQSAHDHEEAAVAEADRKLRKAEVTAKLQQDEVSNLLA